MGYGLSGTAPIAARSLGAARVRENHLFGAGRAVVGVVVPPGRAEGNNRHPPPAAVVAVASPREPGGGSQAGCGAARDLDGELSPCATGAGSEHRHFAVGDR